MAEKLNTIAEVFGDARTAAMNPRRGRRYLTCPTCGQTYDNADPAQVAHHASAAHPKWTP